MEWLLSHCNAAFSQHGAWWLVFLMAGLAGGFTHCLTMCGPFSACDRLCAISACAKKSGLVETLSLPFHTGRLACYSAMGFAASLVASQFVTAPWWPYLSSVMLGVAGLLFLLNCISGWHPRHVMRFLSSRPWLRGMLLGFMPCGLLYAALMMAATLPNPISGMVAMALFTLGTLPALWLASVGASMAGRRWQRAMRPAGHTLMAFNGLSLLVMATHIMR